MCPSYPCHHKYHHERHHKPCLSHMLSRAAFGAGTSSFPSMAHFSATSKLEFKPNRANKRYRAPRVTWSYLVRTKENKPLNPSIPDHRKPGHNGHMHGPSSGWPRPRNRFGYGIMDSPHIPLQGSNYAGGISARRNPSSKRAARVVRCENDGGQQVSQYGGITTPSFCS